MYSVRIDKDGDGYVFKVQPCEGILEIVGLDSTPGIIAMVHANDPGHACWRAWDMAEHMHDEQPGQLPLSPEARAALDAGLVSAASGEIANLGSFARFVDDGEDET